METLEMMQAKIKCQDNVKKTGDCLDCDLCPIASTIVLKLDVGESEGAIAEGQLTISVSPCLLLDDLADNINRSPEKEGG